MVGVHDGERVDVVALTLRLGGDALALVNRGGAFREILRGRRDVGIPEQAKCNAPIGNAALGIGFQNILERLLRCAVPERVLVQHGAVELFLRFGCARCFEMHLAKLLVALPKCRLRKQRDSHRRNSNHQWCFDHSCLPVFRDVTPYRMAPHHLRPIPKQCRAHTRQLDADVLSLTGGHN